MNNRHTKIKDKNNNSNSQLQKHLNLIMDHMNTIEIIRFIRSLVL